MHSSERKNIEVRTRNSNTKNDKKMEMDRVRKYNETKINRNHDIHHDIKPKMTFWIFF
jgi:hypothetical protein